MVKLVWLDDGRVLKPWEISAIPMAKGRAVKRGDPDPKRSSAAKKAWIKIRARKEGRNL